ncbi:hypothetical protein HDR63_00180 [bacterium]|nr:hypothetical protein [bacterium]
MPNPNVGFWVGAAHGAGYTCPSSKQYTSCNAGYYLTGGTGPGNACTKCPDGCTCADNQTPECHADKPCAGNLSDATGGTIAWNGSTWDYSACYKTCNNTSIAHGLSYYTGNTWGECHPDAVSNACHWGYYKDNNSQSCQACPAGYWCDTNQYVCPAGYFCPTGIYNPKYAEYGDRYKCPDGYTSDEGSTGLNKCYRACTRACTQQTCPENASCTHGNTSNSGIEYYGAACSAAATTCTLSFSCDPGYYGSSANGDTSCADCGAGNYCTGGAHRATCAATLPAGAPAPGRITTLANGNWGDRNKHGVKSTDCICEWFFNDETRTNYEQQAVCSVGPSGPTYTYYYECRPGYYADNSLGWGEWYTACSPCDNGPAHAHYTSYSTPSVMYAVESNCPWACDDGYGRVGDTCQPLCATGVTTLHAGDGVVPLFGARPSSPALAVQAHGGICYGNLMPGRGTGLNITVQGTTYHLE